MTAQYRLVVRVPGRGPVGSTVFPPVESWAGLLDQAARLRRMQRRGYVRADAVFTVERREHGPAPWKQVGRPRHPAPGAALVGAPPRFCPDCGAPRQEVRAFRNEVVYTWTAYYRCGYAYDGKG